MGPRDQDGCAVYGKNLEYEVHQHLNIRYEVEELDLVIGLDGKIYINNAVLKPRDEL